MAGADEKTHSKTVNCGDNSVYETRIIEASDRFRCEISFKPRQQPMTSAPRFRYRQVTGFMQALQAVVIVLGVL
ncbi:MAG: hypothetical protein FJ189_00825 [Gammaproteobacteria bacterium]|nr:hypothetical protein [Gammaproteobacteria bacterium]